jgi:type I restriction enzyme M protein
VKVVDPKKDETILDPACGTAGFLISAYKHILKSNENKPLTPDEKKRLMGNLAGYDISPDMVKLSLVNMYLHGFPSPNIHEYDTLTSDERWDERYDVMMANPPFMTPKGGIRPHKRFMVQANRSEVLFVDYILEHLNNKGRAGIIVPEGVIFQSSGAYTQLRNFLLEKGLFGIVSLPVGVFNPYTKTTKTSILFVDREVQASIDGVVFIKVNSDGFDLGAERFPITDNDLPHALDILRSAKGLGSRINGAKKKIYFEIVSISNLEKRINLNLAILHDVEDDKQKLYSNIEIGRILNQEKTLISISDNKEYKQITVKMNGKGVILRGTNKGLNIKTKRQFVAHNGDFIMSKIDARNGAFGIVPPELDGAIVTQDFPLFTVNKSVMLPEFLNIMMQSPQFIKICQRTSIGTSNRRRIKIDNFLSSRIPLPDIGIQKGVVSTLSELHATIEKHGEQIKGCQQLIDKEIAKVWGE